MSGKNILMVIAHEHFKDEEYFWPKEIFHNAGFKVVTSSSKKNALSSDGESQEADILIETLGTDDALHYAAVVLVGGGGAQEYFHNIKFHDFLKDIDTEGNIIGAICIAPAILAFAGLLKGKRATAFPSVKDELVANGAKYTGRDVERDANIITANGPAAAKDFAHEIVEALGVYEQLEKKSNVFELEDIK